MWPKAAWKKLYEPSDPCRRGPRRRAGPAGPGPLCVALRPLRRAGGSAAAPAGIAAALAAAETGARVILADEQAEFGGSLRFESRATIDGQDGFAWAAGSRREAAGDGQCPRACRARPPSATTRRTSSAWSSASPTISPIPVQDLPRERLWQVRARRVILATGAIERHMVFADNDRPGIMLASAARTYLNHYGVAVGRNVGVYTANDSAYAAAIDLKKAGIGIAAIVDLRDNPSGAVVDEARALGIEINHGRAVIGTRRTPARLLDDRPAEERRRQAHDPGRRAADLGGLDAVGASLLAVARQGRLRRSDEAVPAGRACAGLRLGRRLQRHRRPFRVRRGSAEGRRAGSPAGRRESPGHLEAEGARDRRAGSAACSAPVPARERRRAARPSSTSRTTSPPRTSARRCGKACDRSSTSSGSRPTAWRPTRARPPTCMGWRLPPKRWDKPIPEVGLTTFRPPYTPVTFGAIVGQARGPLFDPTRKTAMHAWAEAHGAVFEDVGQWKRPWYFPTRRRGHACRRQPGVRDRPQQCRPVRRLDARQDRGGRPRRRPLHGAPLHQSVAEAGARPLPLWDHAQGRRLHLRRRRGGTAGCRPLPRHHDDRRRGARDEPHGGLSPDRIPASRRLAHLDLRAMGGDRRAGAEIPGHRSSRWSKASTCRTRPCRIWRCARAGSAACRPGFSRMSFTGERGYEVNVPADYGEAVWEALWAEGEKHGATPTARRRCTSCVPRRASSSSARTPTGR